MSDLPANLELEASILGTILAHNEMMDVVADTVTPRDFSQGLHQRIFEAAYQQFSTTGVSNPATLFPMFKEDPDIKELGGPSYLAKLTADTTAILDPRGMAKQLADTARRRRIVAGLREAAEAASDPNTSITEAIGLADDAMGEQAAQGIEEHGVEECFDEMLAGYQREKKGVTCGIATIDDAMGMLAPGSMNVVAARPGMGKTAWGLTYARCAAEKGYCGLYVSLEMPGDQLAQRMAADICFDTAKVPYEHIRDGHLTEQEHRAVLRAKQHVSRLPLRIASGSNLAVGRLAALIRRTKRRFEAHGGKLSFVVVDYLQLLRPDVRMRSEYEAVSEISTMLKSMAMQNDVALIALAQLSREVEKRDNKRPTLSDLRASGQIEQDADLVMFLLRPEYYLQQMEVPRENDRWEEHQAKLAEVRNQIQFIVGKRRNGVNKTSTGEFYGEYQAVR